MARRVSMAEINGGRVRGRPSLGCMDGVEMAMSNRGMTVELGYATLGERSERVESPGA